MSYREENIITALKQVVHPEKGKDIVSLNMVEDLEVKGKKSVLLFILIIQMILLCLLYVRHVSALFKNM